MSKRDSGWRMILQDNKVREWLNDKESMVLQVKSQDFSAVGRRPVRMIPTYSASGLPEEFHRLGIELLRNQAGGCLLIKTKQASLPTLFPNINEPEAHYHGKPFQPVPRLTVLASRKSALINEETGVHLAWGTGVFQSFFMDCFSPHEIFTFGGRLKTRVRGQFEICSETYPVDALVEVDGHFESDERIVVLEAKQSEPGSPREDFSIHQLVLPLMLVRSESDKICTGLLLDWSIDRDEKGSNICFMLYHYSIPGTGSSINPFRYELTKSKTFSILL